MEMPRLQHLGSILTSSAFLWPCGFSPEALVSSHPKEMQVSGLFGQCNLPLSMLVIDIILEVVDGNLGR